MMNPNLFSNPGRMSDSLYFDCSEQRGTIRTPIAAAFTATAAFPTTRTR